MAVIEIGDTTAKIKIYDHATPASGVYIWYISTDNTPAIISRPRKPLAAIELAAQTNILKKDFDYTGGVRINKAIIKSAADWANYEDMLEYYDATDKRLYCSVKNEWNIELANRASSKADAAALPITQNIFRGKLFSETVMIHANRAVVNIEFRYTTA